MAPERNSVEDLDPTRRLAESRAAIEALLKPLPAEFPRSHTMRFLLGRKGKVVAVAAAVALYTVRPHLAITLTRFLPVARLVQRLL